MKIKNFILLIVSLFLILNNLCLYASPDIKNKFSSMQKQYFPKLDFRVSQSALKTLPEFAAQWDSLAQDVHQQITNKKLNTKEDKELAGLILIYDAMLNSNIVIGIIENKLSLADFKKVKHFANLNATPGKELQARLDYVISELEMAATLRPDDRRIDSWIAGAKNQKEKFKIGHISKASQVALLKAINARPSFNLWTAILNLHTQPAASNQGLLQAAKNFVDAADHGKDPCTLHPSDCVSSWKAPFNFQASVTELGDVFLQQAEYYLKKGESEKAMMLAGYAEGTYKQLFKSARIKETEQWPDYSALTVRKEKLADLQKQIIPKTDLASSDNYQRVYECASCHGRQ